MHMDTFAFKTLVRARRKAPDGAVLRKLHTNVAELTGDRTARFVISDGGVDRDRDTVSVLGWKLDEFMKNPVGLWEHGHSIIGGAPIARVRDVGPDGPSLKAEFEFQAPDVPVVGDWAEMVYRSLKSGFLRATSVGFLPNEFVLAKDRMEEDDWFPPVDFTRQTLLEVSIVSVPSNPRALLEEEPVVASVPFGNTPPVIEDAARAAAGAVPSNVKAGEQWTIPVGRGGGGSGADAAEALAELRAAEHEAERAAVVRTAEKRAHQRRMLAAVGLL